MKNQRKYFRPTRNQLTLKSQPKQKNLKLKNLNDQQLPHKSKTQKKMNQWTCLNWTT